MYMQMCPSHTNVYNYVHLCTMLFTTSMVYLHVSLRRLLSNTSVSVMVHVFILLLPLWANETIQCIEVMHLCWDLEGAFHNKKVAMFLATVPHPRKARHFF